LSDEFYLPEDVVEWIAQKKSEYLSKLIEKVGPDDFGFEAYHQFDDLISQTIGEPDKAFESQIENYQIRIFLRTYKRIHLFHQVVIGVLIPDHQNKSDVYIPILTIVSKDEELVKIFTVGEVIARPTLN